MKVIPLHNDAKTRQWISLLKKGENKVQKEVYEFYAPKMLSVCRMYVKDLQHAEDCMIKAFVKVFKNIHQFESKGSFPGWIRRIMVNECLTFLRLRKEFVSIEDESYTEFEPEKEFGFDAQELLDTLPLGYRLVFNLFVMEEMSHKEIANQLNISESTSKSQLHKAKQKLRDYFIQENLIQK